MSQGDKFKRLPDGRPVLSTGPPASSSSRLRLIAGAGIIVWAVALQVLLELPGTLFCQKQSSPYSKFMPHAGTHVVGAETA